MKITDIRTIRLRAPMGVQGQVESRTGVRTHRYAFLVEVHTDEGVTGVGSCSGNGLVLEAIVAHVLKPLLIGMDPLAIEEVWDTAYFRAGVRAFGSRGVGVVALSGVDIALWDIAGKVKECRCTSCWGASAATRSRSTPPRSIPRQPQPRWEKAEKLAERGFHGIKIKVGFDLAQDIEIVGAVRAALGPDFPLMTDANMGYSLDAALAAAAAFEKLGIGWLEEPLFMEDVAGHAQLKARTGVPWPWARTSTPVSPSNPSWPATLSTCCSPTWPGPAASARCAPSPPRPPNAVFPSRSTPTATASPWPPACIWPPPWTTAR